MLQTQVEEQQFQNEVLTAQADADNASIALSGFLGRDRGETVLIPGAIWKYPHANLIFQPSWLTP